MALKKLRHHRDGRDALVEAGSETEKHFLANGFVEAREASAPAQASAPTPALEAPAQDNARRVPRGSPPPASAA